LFPGGEILLHPSGTTFFFKKCAPRAIFWYFLAKFLTLFEKAAGRGESVVAGHTPNSLGINIYIKRVSHNSIGRLGASKNFWHKKCIFLDLVFFHFFIQNFPADEPAFFSKKINKILAGFTTGFFLIWKREIRYFQYV